MRKFSSFFGLGVLLVGAYVVFSSIFIVTEREQALVVRFGEIKRVIEEPGIYFKIPTDFIDTVQYVEDRLIRFDLDDMRVQVSGGKFYEVDAFLAYRIFDPRRFRETVSGDLVQAEQRLRTRFDAALRGVYGLRGFQAALSAERGEMMREVRDLIRPEAESLGLNIVDVRIRRTDLTREVSAQTYERMKSERFAEAAIRRARGQEAAARIRADAKRQVVEILAKARRESEILRGEGEGERNKIFADAFQRDPEFFAFYRSMIAYAQALQDSGTTMVLSPNSDFFRYFRDPNGGTAATEPGAADLSRVGDTQVQ